MKRTPYNCPTLWMHATHPLSHHAYHFRVNRHRRGGTCWIETRKDSPTRPDTKVALKAHRAGMFDAVHAATELLSAVEWDPTTDKRYVACQPVWRTRTVAYTARRQHAVTVLLYLEVLLARGTGRRARVQVVEEAREALVRTRLGGVHTGYAKARENKRIGMLKQLATLTVETTMLRESLGAKRRFVGYTAAEHARLVELAGRVQAAVAEMRDVVFDNRFSDDPLVQAGNTLRQATAAALPMLLPDVLGEAPGADPFAELEQ